MHSNLTGRSFFIQLKLCRACLLYTSKVYIAISADILHQGHINLIDRASKLGDLTVGVLTDAAVSSYKRYPLLDFESRKEIISHIKGFKNVVAQNDIDYTQNLSLILI